MTRKIHGSSTDVDMKLRSSDRLIVVTEPATITLADDPRTDDIVQIVTDAMGFPGAKVSIHGGRFHIKGGHFHLHENSIVTLKFTSEEVWVSKGPRARTEGRGEEGPRGHEGDVGRRGRHGPTGATGPCCTGPTGSTGASGPTGQVGPTGPSTATDSGSFILTQTVQLVGDVPLSTVKTLLLTASFSVNSFIPFEDITILATFSAFSTVAGDTADFSIEVDGVLQRGAEITFDATSKGSSGTISTRKDNLGIGTHLVKLFAIASSANVAINQGTRPSQDHASLTVLETVS